MRKVRLRNRTLILTEILIVVFFAAGVIYNRISGGMNDFYGSLLVTIAIIAPAFHLFIDTGRTLRLFFCSAVIISTILAIGFLFWDYMDKPWFSPSGNFNCDGPCFGWFSFENEFQWQTIIIAGTASSAAGLITRHAFIFIIAIVFGRKRKHLQ
jgi:hypothetical protein